jgi:hypothetical protein
MLLYVFMTEQVTSHWKAEHSHTTSPHSQAWKTIPLVSTSQGLFDSCFWVSKLNLLCAPYISTSGHETRFNYKRTICAERGKIMKKRSFLRLSNLFSLTKNMCIWCEFLSKNPKKLPGLPRLPYQDPHLLAATTNKLPASVLQLLIPQQLILRA